MKKYIYIFIALTGLLLSCSKVTEDYREKQAQALYRESLQLYKEGEYDDAIMKFKEALKYIDYLSPEQIKDIKYKMAVSYYKKEDYINAVVFLEDFVTYYPKAEETEYAYYLLIESYFHVAPDAYRDQSYTEKAVEKAKEFLIKFPKSNYTEKVKNIMKKALRKIARHEYLIARFYEDYGYYYSAAKRYKDLLINSYEYIDEEEIAFRYIKNLFMTGRQAEEEMEKYRSLIRETMEKYNESEEEDKEKIKNRIEFYKRQIKRWKEIYEEARREAEKALERYAEIYGKNKYYKELLKWKSSSL